MAKISPFGRYRAFDTDGAPLAGGKLYTYEAGTSTPKNTYTDNGGLTANPNPTILDADGYGDVWLGTGGYKFILKDANDNLLWTKDNIDGGNATGFASSVITNSSSFSLSINEQNNVVVCTAAITVSLLPVATAGDGFAAIIINTSAGNVTIDPDGAETINGAATLLIPRGFSATIYTNSITWYASGVTPSTGFPDNVFKIQGSSDNTKTISFEVDGLTTGTNRTVTVQDVTGTMYVSGGTDVAVADGGTGASTAAAGFDNLKQAATTSYVGAVQLATTAEVNTGTDTVKVVTPAALLGSLGATQYAETAWQAVTANSQYTLTHNIGRMPKIFGCLLKCTTINNYAVGDIIPAPEYSSGSAKNWIGYAAGGSTTVATFFLASTSIDLMTQSNTSFTITAGSWQIKFYVIG